jgi:putative peptidoglycan lipid II flippase
VPLVSVLYERGATGPEDVAAIAVAVAVYGAGLPAFMLQKVLQPLYFAREDTKTPFRYALVAMLVNAGLAFGLKPVLGWIAPAIAASAAGWAMVALLALGARSMGEEARFDARFRRRAWRILAASAVMGAVLYAAAASAGWLFALSYWRYLSLLGLVMLGGAVYFTAGQAFGAFRLSEFRSALSRRKQA